MLVRPVWRSLLSWQDQPPRKVLSRNKRTERQERCPKLLNRSKADSSRGVGARCGAEIMRGTWTVGVAIIIVAALVVGVLAFSFRPSGSPTTGPPSVNTPQCKGTAACFTDTVTYIVDGDTLDVGSTRIRLALVNSPEVGEPGYTEAKQFTAQTCPVGTQALVDEDDGQTGGSYGRMVAVVYCGGVNLNAALLSSGNAVLVTYYCSVSEFASEPWTGCP